MDRIARQILQNLLGKERSVYELIYYQDASLREFFELLNTLKDNGLIELENGKVRITEKGREIAEEERVKFCGEIECKSCDGTGLSINPYFKEILNIYSEIAKNRPETIEIYDQGFISLEDIVRRVEFIYDRGDLNGRIFVVGDDDLFSIAASLTGMPEKVVVVDIDERLIKFINGVAEEYSLNVEAFVYDVQKAFPEEFKRKFDLFVTDPVETIPGLKLFLSRGVSTLKGVGGAGLLRHHNT